jgi:hypothetical protein
MPDARWYAAVLLLQSRVGIDLDDEPLVDHQVRLLRARDADTAYEQALVLGKSEEVSYQNDDGETVTWTFIGLGDLEELDEPPGPGTEVFSWYTRGPGLSEVCSRGKLTVFANLRDAHKTARELLDE